MSEPNWRSKAVSSNHFRDAGEMVGYRSACGCENWCRVDPLGEMGNGHHPRCKHYIPDPPDSRHAVFGKLMWDMIQKMGGDFCGDEWSEEVLPLAERAGLCSRVTYDPAKHGDGIEAEPGNEIWWWGNPIPNDQDQGHSPALTLAQSPCSAWWLAGWQRKYRTLDNHNDRYVARVFCRLLVSDDRYQRQNKMGKYSLPNALDDL